MIPKTIHYCWFGENPLPDLAIKCIESWKKYLPDYEIISETEKVINGMNAYEVVGAFTLETIEMKSKSIYIEKNRVCFIITYVAILDDYDTYLSIVDQSINSFTIV